jgi:hypothetical protein
LIVSSYSNIVPTDTLNFSITPFQRTLIETPGRDSIIYGDTTILRIITTGEELLDAQYSIIRGNAYSTLQSLDSTVIGDTIDGVFPSAILRTMDDINAPDSLTILIETVATVPCPECMLGKIASKDSSKDKVKDVAGNRKELLSQRLKWIHSTAQANLQSIMQMKNNGKPTQTIGSLKTLANVLPLSKTTKSVSPRLNKIQYDGLVKYLYGLTEVTVIKKHTILLGETKYYYATPDPNNTNNLIISETATPALGAGGLSNATFDDPVAANGSEKNPVYWEDQYPIYSGTTFTGSNTLPNGMIRLVGRYWEQGKTFTTTLAAHTPDGKSGTVDIEVKKPSKLGNAPQTATDVKGNPYALDDSIITHAGITGILPQYIKAMIRNETVGRFAPSYRYEPFTDLKKVQIKDGKGNYTFKSITTYWINSSSDLGTPGIPTDHSNLYNALGKINSYPGYQTVWDIYNTDMNNSQSLYSLAVYGNKYGLEDEWIKFYNTGKAKYHYSDAQASDSANAQFIRWMRDTWSGGMINVVAQTRIASSYGLLQLVYYYGVKDAEYPVDANHRPEDINLVYNSLYYGILHFSNKLKSVINISSDSNNWPNGLEGSYLQGLNRYNGTIKYANDVIQYSQQYLPQQ